VKIVWKSNEKLLPDFIKTISKGDLQSPHKNKLLSAISSSGNPNLVETGRFVLHHKNVKSIHEK
jgi:hypothetical protein